MRSSLMRDWDLFQTQLIPLLSGTSADPARAWSIGDTNDAVAVTVAFAVALGSTAAPMRTFASSAVAGTGAHLGDVGLKSADLGQLSPASRAAWFRRLRNCWVPRPAIADRILLAPPSESVDLITVRGAGRLDPTIGDSLRDGGVLFFVDGPPPPIALCSFRPSSKGVAGSPGWIRPTDDRRLFRKVGGPVAPAVSRSPDVSAPETLAARLRQEELVLAHAALARSLARRFGHRGQPVEDLEQVALLALIGAARRYDPDRGTPFVSYATASVMGELKRYFRDRTWSMRVPRSLQELHLVVGGAREELGHRLGQSPTVAQVAAHIGVGEEDVLEAMEAGHNYRVESLDFAPGDDDRVRDVPIIDGSFDQVLDRERLRAALPRLDHREMTILKGLYLDERTQQDVALELGVSQMHVSRLAARAVAKLRR